jgi:hypothetical protein
VIVIFLALAGAVGVREHWAAFLFLFQWSMMEEMKLNRLPQSALGVATGIAIASLPAWLTPLIGTAAAAAVMPLAVLVAVFLLIRKMGRLVINPATMAFLTVATIPHIMEATKPADIFLGLITGVFFFGGLAAIAKRKAALTDGTRLPA